MTVKTEQFYYNLPYTKKQKKKLGKNGSKNGPQVIKGLQPGNTFTQSRIG